MGIEDANPHPDAYDQLEQPTPPRPAPPSWADESTIAVPLSELFGDDPEE